MADFKKIPEGSGGEPLDVITAEMAAQFAAIYWPAMLGGITLFVLIFRGHERTAIPVGAAAVLLQAWQLGVFG